MRRRQIKQEKEKGRGKDKERWQGKEKEKDTGYRKGAGEGEGEGEDERHREVEGNVLEEKGGKGRTRDCVRQRAEVSLRYFVISVSSRRALPADCSKARSWASRCRFSSICAARAAGSVPILRAFGSKMSFLRSSRRRRRNSMAASYESYKSGERATWKSQGEADVKTE